ncbi:MAG: 2-isopropylmalate synthase [Candidatus Marinimicrobia bacterium]|jgi:2-isopropylmalate synthase|nr:2-isopropylmalate synthase [Candidatus Neomarinimicrobiota bacterium]MBT3676725.1 2-isopropylmalate synthase [Candidatus Neomarinimicrobiota bacterium]MBT3764172.1 2-isopropylmalate synthase [Candidatus Neomarinimicrobiota bacterium]MBT4068518.1 2-isopropylmalate synthase [Candidatus Neomarinimicrobiota bacterium]MBT4271439.1 2-isopropylmalate synthase [Candidatus Neomarinimicrobiota bacterium]
MKDKIVIFDTTLRDGEQAPGCSLNLVEKIEIAKQLNKLNVDVIEAGYPVSSKVQFDAVQRIADAVDTVVAGLARTVDKDVKAAYDALKHAETFRIHTFAGTSDIHMMGKFGSDRYGKTLEEKRQHILKISCDAVALAKTFTDDVEFSPEDAGRTDIGYLSEIVEAVIAAGATTVNIPDTTGYTMPLEFGEKIAELKRRVSNIDQAVISVHCHNDLGLAVANSLSAITNGARQVECTINGIGERAGNASLEEIVMALAVREDLWDVETKINTSEIFNASRMVSSFTGMVVQPNKAIVGDNAFAHESGIHQDGMLKDNKTYEIINPEEVGVHESKIILGRHSGRHGLDSRLKAIGFDPSEEELNSVYQRFLELADKKKEVFDDDLRLLMGQEVVQKDYRHFLDYLHVNLGTTTIPTATVRIKSDDRLVEESATGDGPVDACFNAIDRALNSKFHIESYQVRSVTVGRSAQGEAHLRLKNGEQSFSGRGVSTDIVEASAKAYLQAINEYSIQSEVNELLAAVTAP